MNTTLLTTTAAIVQTVTTSINMTNTVTSLFEISPSVTVLVWFEIITAGITYGLGFIGNLLSLIIFASQEEFRNVSTGVLFLLMTISNTIHLWTLSTEFLGTFNIYIYFNVFLQCRLNYFVQNVSRAVSTYLIITVTLDRWIRSKLPLRSRVICTRRNAIKLSFIYLITFSILLSFWFCPLFTFVPNTGICYTGQSPIFNSFFNNVFLPVRLILVCIIPVIVMTSANIRILLNIRQSRRRVEQGNQMNTTGNTTIGGVMVRRMKPVDRMMLYMMLINVSVFILTQIPFHIYTIVRTYNMTLSASTSSLTRAILLVWSSIYFGVGFYFYSLASPLFRKKFITMIKDIIHRRMRHQRR